MTGPAPCVTMRPTRAGDVGRVVEWERDPENAPFVEAWSHELHARALSEPAMRHFIIESGDRDVGFVILAGIDGRSPIIELRRLVVTEKGRGIGKATVSLVLRYAFEELDAKSVRLDFVAGNTRARHTYETQGFRVQSVAELWAEIGGARVPLVVMTLSRAEFERRTASSAATGVGATRRPSAGPRRSSRA